MLARVFTGLEGHEPVGIALAPEIGRSSVNLDSMELGAVGMHIITLTYIPKQESYKVAPVKYITEAAFTLVHFTQ